MAIPAEIKALEDDVNRQIGVLDIKELGQKIFAVSEAFRQALNEFSQSTDDAGRDELIAAWERFLDTHEDRLMPIIRGVVRCQLNVTAGNLWQQRALRDYNINSDFITTPAQFETAEGYFERAIKSFESVKIDPPNEKLAAMRDADLVMPRMYLMEARGMKKFTQGQFELESGNLLRAVSELEGAVKELRSADEAKQKSGSPEMAELTSLQFVDFADALFHQSKSDKAVLEGDLKSAAVEQAARADALDRCRAMHARVSPTRSEASAYFVKRLTRDAFFARQRQNRYEQAALLQPRRPWLKSLAFVWLTVLLAALLVVSHWLTNIEVVQELMLIGAAAVVAGVGSAMITWREGADAVLKALAIVSGGKTAKAD